jgi:hypothetical protein
LADKDETVYGHSSLSEAGIEVGLFPKDLIQGLLALNKEWSDTRRKPEVMPPPNDTSPLANVSYCKPGTPMTDNIHLFVRPPKDAGGFYTVEDAAKTVLAHGRTIDEIALEWRQIHNQKVIVEKLIRQSYGGSDQRLNLMSQEQSCLSTAASRKCRGTQLENSDPLGMRTRLQSLATWVQKLRSFFVSRTNTCRRLRRPNGWRRTNWSTLFCRRVFCRRQT